MVFAEIAQREAVQMPLMGRIAEGTEVGVVRSDDEHAATGLEQSMEFFQGSNDIRDMFDDVDRTDFTKRAVLKREREVVEIGDYVSIRVRVPIHTDRTRIFLNSAAYVEDPVRRAIRR